MRGRWRGYIPLSGDVLWNPPDAVVPYALILDPRRWTSIVAGPCPVLRDWRDLEGAAGAPPPADRPTGEEPAPPHFLEKSAIKR
jgi:hypothetical protein